MSPVDLFAALTGTSGAAPAQPKGAATAGADFLSALAALQGDGGPLEGQGDRVDPDAAAAPAHDLKGELLSGAALFIVPAAPVTPVQLSAAALAAADAEAGAEAEQPLPGAPNNQMASGESGDETAPAVPNRGGAAAPASGAEPSAAQTRAQAALDQPQQTERQTPAGEVRPANGEAQPDVKSAMAAAKAAEAALAARSPQSPAMPVPVPVPATPGAKAQATAAAAAADSAQADKTAAARMAASAAGQASTTAADGKTTAQAAATGETALQVRQMARSQGEAEADTRRDGRQERMAPAQFRLNGEAASATTANAGPTASTAPAATPSTTAPAAFAAPAAPPQAPAPEILPAAPEPLPADTLETSAEAETVRLQEAATARNTAAGSQLSRATIETTALIASQIIKRLDGRATRFDMALTPAGLGRVDVRVEIDSDGRLAARLAFDNPAAATDLRGRADELRRELQEAGFQLAEDALDFSDREQGSARHAFEREDRAFRGAGRLAAEADEAVNPPAPGRWRSLTMTPEGVDMKV